jgi:hypothetical protein
MKRGLPVRRIVTRASHWFYTCFHLQFTKNKNRDKSPPKMLGFDLSLLYKVAASCISVHICDVKILLARKIVEAWFIAC